VNTPPVEDEPPVFQEVQPPEFAPIMKPTDAPPVAPQADGTPDAQQAGVFDAALPAWDPAMVSAPPLARNEAGPAPDELAASPARQARVQSFLMSQSRGAAPLEDLNAEYTPPVNLAGFGAGAPRRTHATTQPAAAPARASGVWDGAVVPVDQIGAKLRVLTPKVGLVRATLSSGDVREGRLHAVGEGHIWIEQTGGTEAIARTRVERLEQIGGPDQATAGDKAAAGTPALTAEKRVRVRTPGGLFYGTIVARDGDTITLLTDDGARVTIEGGSVERAPERKTVVKKEATPKPPKPKPDPVPDAHRDPALEDAAPAAHGSTPGG
jgi:hypothetical protein